MCVRAAAASAGITAASAPSLGTRGWRFKGLRRILPICDRLLYSGNILLLSSRRFSGHAARTVPVTVTAKVQLLAIRQRQGNCTRSPSLDLFSFEDPVTFNQ